MKNSTSNNIAPVGKNLMLCVEINARYYEHKNELGYKYQITKFECTLHDKEVFTNVCKNCEHNISVVNKGGIEKSYCKYNQIFNNARIEIANSKLRN